MYLKIHKTEENIVIAVCDENLIGKSFKEKNCKLEITERFFKGKRHGEKDVVEILKTVNNANIVGEKAIKAALKAGIIEEEGVMRIKGIPHAIYCRV